MNTASPTLNFFLELAKTEAVVSRYFDSRLGGGLGLNDVLILYRLSRAEGEKMRRIDLAKEVGLTASGITRLLAPMEKIGLIKREANSADARVSFVALAPGGRRLLSERLEKAELLAKEALPASAEKKITELSRILIDISRLAS